jgi:hypothetical protein
MSLKPLIILAALGSLSAAPAGAQQVPNPGREQLRQLGMEGLTGRELEEAIAGAEAHPLGSAKNPIRENMPAGQRAYLGRLRCASGEAPVAERAAGAGSVGVYGYIVDRYDVTCPGAAPVQVYIDMYHDGPEHRPIPGFSIAAVTRR